MIYISADEIKRCKPLLIFKGSTGAKNACIKKKMTQYDTEVVVQWNPKAYCNAEVMIRWLKQQYKYATHGFITSDTSRLLTLDVFSRQKIDEVKYSWSINLRIVIYPISRSRECSAILILQRFLFPQVAPVTFKH